MSKRFVFLYCTQKDKEILLQYESVIRALLRKFRKSALFSYLQIDPSPSCRSQMIKRLEEETSRSGAIFLESDEQNASMCEELLKSTFDFYASAHYVSGRAICYPEHKEDFVQVKENDISHTFRYDKENINKTTTLSLDTAKSRKHSLSLCLNQASRLDSAFLEEAQKNFGKAKHIAIEYIPLEEMISLCVNTIPSFDVVLTLKEYAPIITMHLNSMPDVPTGYIVNHGEKHMVYRRQILPHEEIGNIHHISSLLAIAAIFEDEFRMKSVADWLRRALSLAFTNEVGATSRDFLKSVISEIQTPIRKRRTE